MHVIPNIIERLQRLESRFETLIMPATVIAVHADTNLLNLSIYEDLELHNVPCLTQRAGTDGQTYWMPEVGEAGMLLCPSGDVANARFMAAFNTTGVPAPETDPAVMLRIFKSGRKEEFNGNDDEHVLTIDQSTRTTKTDEIKDETGDSSLALEAAAATLKSTKATLQATGAAEVKGATISISATGAVTIKGTLITLQGLVNVLGTLQVGGVPLLVP